MPQAIVDPEELRRFASSLKKFSTDVQERTSSLNGQLAALERTWRDQEQKKFAEEFEQQILSLCAIYRDYRAAHSLLCCARRRSSRSTYSKGSGMP